MKRINLIALFVFIGLVIWIFSFDNATTQSIQKGAMSLLSPFIRGGNSAKQTYKDIKEPKRSRSELAGENEQMKLELAQLRVENERLQTLARDNDTFRLALDLQANSSFELVSAKIISRRTSTWNSTLILDKGYDEGVTLDAPVVTAVLNENGRSDTGLVGKTTLVNRHESTVILLTDEKCQVAAKVFGKTEQGICMGQRGATERTPYLKLRFLPRESNLVVGSRVFSSNVGGLFPYGLLIGDIVEFERLDYDAEATIQPAVDFAALEHVFVIVEQPPPLAPIESVPEAKATILQTDAGSDGADAEKPDTGTGRAPVELVPAVEASATIVEDAGETSEVPVVRPAIAED